MSSKDKILYLERLSLPWQILWEIEYEAKLYSVTMLQD